MKEHLVYSEHGEYYLSTLDPETIKTYSESCGRKDTIILTFTKGYLCDALVEYFSELAYSEKYIKEELKDTKGLGYMEEYLAYEYNSKRDMIKSLVYSNIITSEEAKKLFKQVDMTENRQFYMLRGMELLNSKIKKK